MITRSRKSRAECKPETKATPEKTAGHGASDHLNQQTVSTTANETELINIASPPPTDFGKDIITSSSSSTLTDTQRFQIRGTRKELYSAVLNSFFAYHGVVSQNINSFNKFLGTHLHDIVTEEPIVSECYTTEPFPVRHEIHFTSVTINRPERAESDGTRPMVITPNDCLNRSLTYSAEIFARGYTLQFEMSNGIWNPVPYSAMEVEGKVKMPKNPSAPKPIPSYEKKFFVFLGKIPVMVRSEACHLSHYKTEAEFQRHRECYLDPGGYFIINGKERVLVAQEKLPENRAVVYECMKHNKFDTECEIRCSVEHSLRPVCVMWIRLMNDKKLTQLKNADGDGDHNIILEDAQETQENQDPRTTTTKSNKKSVTFYAEDDASDEELDSENKKANFIKNIFKNAGGKQFVVVIPRLKEPIPLVLLFKALGYAGVDFIKLYVLQGDTGPDAKAFLKLIQFSLDLWDETMTQDKALEIIGSLVQGNKPEMTKAEHLNFGREVINDNVLQNIGNSPDYDVEKGRFVCEMIRRACEVHFGRRDYDDRDNLLNKRFELAGALFLQLFKRIWKQISFDAQRGIKRRLEYGTSYDVKAVINDRIITRGFNYSVSTGNWTDRKGSSSSTGISHELNRLSYVSALSHLRRVTTPPKLHRSVAARQMHNTNWGMICPNETPEGEPVGLVQNFALSACVTVGCSSEPVLEYLSKHGMMKLSLCTNSVFATTCKIFVNGQWVGVHKHPMDIINGLRKLRRSGRLHPEISVSFIDRQQPTEVEIRTDAGRIYRPLLRVERNCLLLTQDMILKLNNPDDPYKWKELLNEGIVEELDTSEIMNTRVAMWESDLIEHNTVNYTHCEIQPSLIVGLGASTIPFANHNQAPRNTYQSGMAKQAIGLYATNFHRRSDLLAHVLHYPHKPLMSTAGAEFSKMCQLPAGQECVVAILTNGGYNQEDSVVVNSSSIDRGLLRSSVMTTYADSENRVSARHEQDECFERPKKSEVRILKTEEYGHLDEDGLPGVGVKIFERQLVIGKIAQCGGIKRDMSTAAKLNTNGVVRDAFITTNEEGQRVHKVVIQETRVPKLGDKIASRHGQKGVIGMIYRQEDMPFTKDGIVPDVVLNPHAIPSRMTWGHLIEALAGKAVCAGKGNLRDTIDATAFSQPLTPDSFAQWLTPAGYHKHGEEVLYDGITGKKLVSTVFMGVNFYQRLRHMVDDKLNIRCRGAVTQLEGQPKRGLTREGAQRYGEMERDCTIAHGSAGVLHERLFTVSDAAYYKICNECGNLVTLEPYVNAALKQAPYFKCKLCDEVNRRSDNLSTIALPKAAKLLYQELLAMNIAIRFKTTSDMLRMDSCVKFDLSLLENSVE